MPWFEKLKRYKRKQEFQPGLLGLFVNPFYFARKGLYRHIQSLSASITGKILDVGCGQKPYKHFFTFTEYIGLDIENPGHDHSQEQIDVYYDGITFPFADDSYDSMLCNQVLEHVFNPELFLKEMNRVLKLNGCLLLTVPFVWDEHEQPNDFARYSSFGLTHLLKNAGFIITDHRKSINDFRLIFQLINAFLYKKTITSYSLVNLLVTLVIMAPVNIMGEVVGRILPKNTDLYLDNIVLARKVRHA